MLVLSRKQKQQIKIGDDVVLTVLQVKGNTVRLGIEAPKEIHVIRGELEDSRASKPTGSTAESENVRRVSAAPARVGMESQPSINRGEIVELKIHGGEIKLPASNRLSEIASSIPTLNISR